MNQPDINSDPTRGSTAGTVPLLELRAASKHFGSVIALRDVSLKVGAGEVTCVLGDNGAGKSTLIKILSGVHPPDTGELWFDGSARRFNSPRDALDAGIATVFQDLAMIPMMSIWRNFFLGSEPQRGAGPARWLDDSFAKRTAIEELAKMGIKLRHPDQTVSSLSGGERQSVAIARAVYFGARVLILDEPTSALGVRQAGVVLKYIAKARDRGLGVIFITHNPSHAALVADRYVLLNRGQCIGTYEADEIGHEQLIQKMSGDAELEELRHEMAQNQPSG